MITIILIVVLLVLVLLILASCVKIVPQAHAAILNVWVHIRRHGMWEFILRFRLLNVWQER